MANIKTKEPHMFPEKDKERDQTPKGKHAPTKTKGPTMKIVNNIKIICFVVGFLSSLFMEFNRKFDFYTFLCKMLYVEKGILFKLGVIK